MLSNYIKRKKDLKTTRVEQHIIRHIHPIWKTVDQNCFYSKNLYNYANYIIRQEFVQNKKWIRFHELDKLIQQSDAYKQLKSQPSQSTLSVLDKAWKSFFVAIKDWKKNPTKYLGMPKLPRYLDKDGRYPWYIKNNISYIKDNVLYFKMKRLSGVTFPTKVKGRLIQVRFIPRGTCYVMEIVTEVDVPEITEKESTHIASIDLGVNNFVTLTNNIGVQPIIINGRGVKSINQYYNKQKAVFQSDLKKRNNKSWSKNLDILTFKRNMRLKNFIHNVSRKVVNYCVENNIDTLVCGYNKKWKQECNMSKPSNQKFMYLPFETLINQLEYKCQDAGMRFVLIDESYTSGTSFFDDEVACKENYDKSRRIKRGLFRACNQLINADVNGSLQIMKKAFPNAFNSYGIEGLCLAPLIINIV